MNYTAAQDFLTHAANAVLCFSVFYLAIAAYTHSWKRPAAVEPIATEVELEQIEAESDPWQAPVAAYSKIPTSRPVTSLFLLPPAKIQPESVELKPKRKRGRPRTTAA